MSQSHALVCGLICMGAAGFRVGEESRWEWAHLKGAAAVPCNSLEASAATSTDIMRTYMCVW